MSFISADRLLGLQKKNGYSYYGYNILSSREERCKVAVLLSSFNYGNQCGSTDLNAKNRVFPWFRAVRFHHAGRRSHDRLWDLYCFGRDVAADWQPGMAVRRLDHSRCADHCRCSLLWRTRSDDAACGGHVRLSA